MWSLNNSSRKILPLLSSTNAPVVRKTKVNQYDEQTLIKWTVVQEAADQPFLGKLAVAYVLVNRMKAWKKSAAGICWQPYQFSCWDGKLSDRGKWLDKVPNDAMYESSKAAVQAYTGQTKDPTNGAIYYMNVELVMQLYGKLPVWWDTDTDPDSEVKIGDHTFRKAKI
jgi:spore germination cell wall hydrolase CwlJ-like protein